MVRKFLRNVIVGILAFTIGIFFIDGVGFAPELTTGQQIKTLFLVGSLLGVINTILLPIANFIFLPIRIITLGIFNIVISIAMVVIAVHFFEGIIIIYGFTEFFLLTFVVWILTFITAVNNKKKG